MVEGKREGKATDSVKNKHSPDHIGCPVKRVRQKQRRKKQHSRAQEIGSNKVTPQKSDGSQG